MSKTLPYEVVQTQNELDEWRVEVVDRTGEGVVRVALFSGPDAKTRAHEYAAWKISTGAPPVPSSLGRTASPGVPAVTRRGPSLQT